jgi:hypothetical protein
MFRTALPVVLFLSAPAFAQGIELPGLSDKTPKAPALPACENHPYSQQNCVRVLACIGDTGLHFDGQARGWDQGVVLGATSEGVPCAGQWRSGGFMGAGTSQMTCQDQLSVNVLYYTQDNETGTVIGRGMDSFGRSIIVWTGQNVLKFLTPDGKIGAELPCGPTPIPIS